MPPCSATRLRTSVRPMPRPPCVRRFDRVTCVNMSNTEREVFAIDADAVVAHRDDDASGPSCDGTSIWPPGSVYLAALFSRLANTCVSRTASPSTMSGSSARSTVSAWSAASISGRLVSTAVCQNVGRAPPAPAATSISPRVMRETSSRSSTSRTRWPAWRSITPTTRPDRGSGRGRASAARAQVRSGASGLRSSWPSVARNSSLRWSAWHAAPRARVRRCRESGTGAHAPAAPCAPCSPASPRAPAARAR